jgi:hypothetical protein
MFRFRNLVFAGILVLGAAAAWGQAGGPFSAPSVRYWLGPTLGDTWVPADSMVAGFNPQVGTTYTIVPADIGKTVSFNNARRDRCDSAAGRDRRLRDQQMLRRCGPRCGHRYADANHKHHQFRRY